MNHVSLLLPYFNRKEYLKVSLDSFRHFYSFDDLEIVIVDDGSSSQHRVEDLVAKYTDLNIKLIRISNKIGTNPSRPYNVAARHATGSVLMLSSPEIVHTRNILTESNKFNDMSYDDYLCFSVFCPTNPGVTSRLISDEPFDSKLEFINSIRNNFHLNVGTPPQAPFANEHGSWYLHSAHRATHLNFLTAILAKKYNDICGFDERFVGTGYDDNEFLDRILPNSIIKYYDSFEAIHVNHPPAYGSGNPISNHYLYESIKTGLSNRWASERWGL
jgi:glycosyltransferase involved in cell wall biosynthesis